MERDYEKRWTVTEEKDGWYWWDDTGNPHGPYDKDFAYVLLDDYDATYYD
jgi:hypothetical protein